MILNALNDYYERLATDPNEDIARAGYSLQKMSFCVVIPENGQRPQFQSLEMDNDDGRSIALSVVVPGQSKPSGAGINPCLLWDNSSYLLGVRADDPKPERTRQSFEAFRSRHLALETEIQDTAFSAVCRFLEWWQPEKATDYPELADIIQSFGCFRLKGETGFVHERPAIRNWWDKQSCSEIPKQGICLVSGEERPLARVHSPKIKGVRGAQTAGASIVSFNLDAFESYGMSQSYNSPVSEQAAFQYATALNRLLADRSRTVLLGDATMVFWTETATKAEVLIPGLFATPPPPAPDGEDNEVLTQLRAFFNRLAQGKPDELAGLAEEADVPFYVLGLSPNSARVSIRYWLVSTVRQLTQCLTRYAQEVDLIGAPDGMIPTTRQLIRETARDADDVPPLLSGSLTHALLSGAPYPLAFYQAILRRIRAEQFVDKNYRKDWMKAMHRRAAAIKAVLIRNYKKEIAVALDIDRPEPAYHLGRWFALLEKTQKDAMGENINATIKDRFFTAASSTPASVFPRLIRLSQHHLNGIESKGLRVSRERQFQEIADRLRDFPRNLSLEAQGLFHLGYYQQMKDLYTKKSDQLSAEIALESE